MEWLAFTTACVVAVIISCAADRLAVDFLHASPESSISLANSIRVIALLIAMQWPSFMYSGALSGSGQQVSLNAIRGVMAVLQWGGGAVLLFAWRPDIRWLFIWHCICFAAQGLVLRHVLLRDEANRNGRFRRVELSVSWRFSVGALLIGITGSLLTQADKMVISRFTEVASFAAYSLAFTLSAAMQSFVAQPVMAIAFPRFAKNAALDDDSAFSREYRTWTQSVVFIVTPLACLLIFFPLDIIHLWLRDRSDAVQLTAQCLPWIAAGFLFNIIMMLPFNAQLASGWTSLSWLKNLVLLPPFLIALLVGVPKYGPIVGAFCWLGVNFSYFLFEVPLMHRRLMKETLLPWWTSDTTLPILAACAVSFAIREMAAQLRFPIAVVLLVNWLACMTAILLILPGSRRLLSSLLPARDVESPPFSG